MHIKTVFKVFKLISCIGLQTWHLKLVRRAPYKTRTCANLLQILALTWPTDKMYSTVKVSDISKWFSWFHAAIVRFSQNCNQRCRWQCAKSKMLEHMR